MHIRKATIEDKEQLINLFRKFEHSTIPQLPEHKRKIRAYKDLEKTIREAAEDHLSKPEYIVIVAEENGLLKGFITGEIKEKKYRVYDKEGYIGGWFVEDEHQNKGVGKQLFDHIVAEFERAGCTHIGLDTHLENTKAIEIYERLGLTKRLITFFKPLK